MSSLGGKSALRITDALDARHGALAQYVGQAGSVQLAELVVGHAVRDDADLLCRGTQLGQCLQHAQITSHDVQHALAIGGPQLVGRFRQQETLACLAEDDLLMRLPVPVQGDEPGHALRASRRCSANSSAQCKNAVSRLM
ncbi:hypothetical protein ACFLIM_11185 [Nonomuraea sp. M3C6]|uniref:Uncharacterized protein n=1 Tax=Nonomuraea marmarensis TaxID=3351344 RepID=A0ABW7AC83_9ACTN